MKIYNALFIKDMEREDNMDDFELTILTYRETKKYHFKTYLELQENNEVTDLALMRGAPSEGIFWTSSVSLSNNIIKTNNKGGTGSSNCTNDRAVGILPVLVPSLTMWKQLLKSKIEIDSNRYQVSFLEYPQEAVKDQEQALLKEKLTSNELLPTGKVYTFDSVTVDPRFEYIPFKGLAYPEYSYQNQKYIYVDALQNYTLLQNYTIRLSTHNLSYFDEKLFVKVEPVLWWMDMEKERLISSKVLLGGLPFRECKKKYHGNFSDAFLKKYLDTYMKKELIPFNVPSKSETFDSSETLQRLVYKRYGKRG